MSTNTNNDRRKLLVGLTGGVVGASQIPVNGQSRSSIRYCYPLMRKRLQQPSRQRHRHLRQHPYPVTIQYSIQAMSLLEMTWFCETPVVKPVAARQRLKLPTHLLSQLVYRIHWLFHPRIKSSASVSLCHLSCNLGNRQG